MIAFRDFKKRSKMLGLIPVPLSTAVAEANQWIQAEQIKVINVETLHGTGDSCGPSMAAEDGVRIWYSV